MGGNAGEFGGLGAAGPEVVDGQGADASAEGGGEERDGNGAGGAGGEGGGAIIGLMEIAADGDAGDGGGLLGGIFENDFLRGALRADDLTREGEGGGRELGGILHVLDR